MSFVILFSVFFVTDKPVQTKLKGQLIGPHDLPFGLTVLIDELIG